MVLSRRVRPYAPVALFPNGAAGEGAMPALFIVSAAALSAMAGPLRWGSGLSLPYEHEDRGADVRNQEKADERGGERKTVFEREQFGCIGGATAEHCHGHPLFVGIGFPPKSGRDRVSSWMAGECARPHTAPRRHHVLRAGSRRIWPLERAAAPT